MSCGLLGHIDVFSFYNSYDNRDVYECQNCGRVTSKDSGPKFRHDVTVRCCDDPQDWRGASPVPPLSVGDTVSCPIHGPTTIVSIKTTQTAGKPVGPAKASTSSAVSSAEPGGGWLIVGGIFVGGLAGLLLGWIPMLIFGGPYFLWVAGFAVFGVFSVLFSDS